jgi:hypothetical protein
MQPSCEKEWTIEFLAQNTPNSFHNQKWRDHVAKIVVDREKSLLPMTQHLVVRKKNIDKLTERVAELISEQKYIRIMAEENREAIDLARTELRNARYEDNKEEVTELKERQQFIRPCPSNECKGYLSSSLKCGLCDIWGCKDCHMAKNSRDDSDHKCNPDDVATVKLLCHSTKPCPKCTVAIYKIEGCDQMWCTQCHTPFEWNTLRIVDETNETIHNPHFYQHQRDINGGVAPRNAGRVLRDGGMCGEIPTFRDLNYKMKTARYSTEEKDIVINNLRLAAHVQFVILPRYRNIMQIDDNSDLRVKYLMGDLSEKKWESELKKRNKKREKDRSIELILTMFYTSVNNLLGNIIVCDRQVRKLIVIEMIELKDYVNKELRYVCDQFKNKVPYINDEWNIPV